MIFLYNIQRLASLHQLILHIVITLMLILTLSFCSVFFVLHLCLISGLYLLILGLFPQFSVILLLFIFYLFFIFISVACSMFLYPLCVSRYSFSCFLFYFEVVTPCVCFTSCPLVSLFDFTFAVSRVFVTPVSFESLFGFLIYLYFPITHSFNVHLGPPPSLFFASLIAPVSLSEPITVTADR